MIILCQPQTYVCSLHYNQKEGGFTIPTRSTPLPPKRKDRKDFTKEKKRKEKKGKEKKNVTVNVGLVFLLSGKKHWSLYKEPSSVWYLIIVQS